MKRLFLLALCPLLLSLTGCAMSNAEYYQHAQLYLGSGDYTIAAQLFDQLGEYEDSAEYALYCAALDALDKGNLPLAQANLYQVHPFKSSDRYLTLIEAMLLQENGDLEGALSIYEALGSFEDSLDRAAQMRDLIPQRDIAQARALMGAARWEQALSLLEGLHGYGDSPELIALCRENITQEAYDQATRLYQQGEYADALSAFEALGDTLDAQARALLCRDTLYQQLEKDYRAASMATAQDLMDRYAAMEDYLSSPSRLRDLQARYQVNLALLDAAVDRPYVVFGSMLWRVILAEDSRITLLCQQLRPATSTDLGLSLTAEEDAATLTYEFPQLTLDLDKFTFTQGQGTLDDPFR